MTTKRVPAADLKPGNVILRGDNWSAGVDRIETANGKVIVTHWFGREVFAADRLVQIEA